MIFYVFYIYFLYCTHILHFLQVLFSDIFSEAQAVTDIDDVTRELCALLRDKLLTVLVLSMTQIRNIYHAKLAQCSVGHVLGMGVSDNILEKAVILAGATKINNLSMASIISICKYRAVVLQKHFV